MDQTKNWTTLLRSSRNRQNPPWKMRRQVMQDELHQRKRTITAQHVRRLELKERPSSLLASKSLQPLHRLHGLARRPRPKTRQQRRFKPSNGQNSGIVTTANGHRATASGIHHRSYE